MVNAANRRACGQSIPCAVHAFKLLLFTYWTRLYKRYVAVIPYVWDIPGLKPASCGEDYHLASTIFPVPPVENGTMDSVATVACLKRQ